MSRPSVSPSHWLVADCGNTDLKLAIVEAATLTILQRQRLTTPGLSNDDTVIQSLNAMLAHCPATASTGLVWTRSLSAVSQRLEQWRLQPAVSDRLVAQRGIEPGHVTRLVDTSGYAVGQLGADRVANLAAAVHHHSGRSVLIVDFGTATSLNLLDGRGGYQGGLLLPGWETYVMALSHPIPAFAAKLSAILAEPLTLTSGCARSTQSSLGQGLAHGYVHQVSGCVEQLVAASDCTAGRPLLIATGGLVSHPQWSQWLGSLFDEIRPDLTQLGLALLAMESCE